METGSGHFFYLRACEFKSYYVVWKQIWVKNKGTSTVSFKSYYVVWKLLEEPHALVRIFCLNRTM